MKAMVMSGVRRWLPAFGRAGLLALVATVLVVGAAGPRSTLPPEVEKLLPHAVLLWQAGILTGPLSFFDLDLVAVGDFTGDSIADIVVSQHTDLFILRGRGAGSFEEPQVGAFYPVEKRPMTLRALAALADDLNRDGALDLIVSASVDDRDGVVFVFENRHGRFHPSASYTLPAPTDWIQLADVTGDRQPDLLVPRFSRDDGITYILAFPREGDVCFGEPIVVGKGHGWPVDLGDVNGDGFTDLVLLHDDINLWPNTGYLHVLWGDSSGFTEGTVIKPTAGQAVNADLGDLDGDRKVDLVVVTANGSLVVVRHIEGKLVEWSELHSGLEARKVQLADIDGDGQLDAVVLDVYARHLAVLAGNRIGGFVGRVAEFVLPLAFFRKLHVADLDGNGLPDIVLNYSSYLFLLWNGGHPRGSSSFPFSGVFLLAVGDLSGNGAPDVIVQGKEGVEVLWNNGRGGLVRASLVKGETPPIAAAVMEGALYTLFQVQRRRLVQPFTVKTYTAYVLRAYDPLGQVLGVWELGENVLPVLAVGDLDGNGYEDLIISGQDQNTGVLRVLWGSGELKAYPIPGRAALVAVADFNGDGRDEVAAVCIADYADLRILHFVGGELHLSEPLVRLPAQPMAVAAGDVEGDGIADPVFISFTVDVEAGPLLRVTPKQMVLGIWFSASKRGGTWDLPLPQGELPWPFTGLVILDLTGDGLGDIVFTTLAATGPVVRSSRGDGTFSEPWSIPIPLGPMFVADLDGNGEPELLGSTQGINPYLWILWNRGKP